MKPSLNWLFAFIPVTLALEHLGKASPPLIFFSAALSIVPIAALIVRSTEQLSAHTGDAIGGLLNATFGNAPELIISLVALRAGLMEMVRASIIGAILVNLVLALGMAFFLGGLKHRDQKYNAGAARTYSTMMMLAALSLAVPSAFSRYFTPEGKLREVAMLNLGIAIALLAAYGMYLLFSLKTHPKVFESVEGGGDGGHGHGHGDGKPWSVSRAVGSLVGASVLAAFMSEVLVGAAEGTGKALGMSQTFIGIVLVSIVGGAAESGSAIAVARKNKMDLSVGIALGSSIQIALFVAPVLVLASYFLAPMPLELSFTRAEVGSLFLAVLIGTMVCGDGQSNWFKGAQLIVVYLIFAMMFYVLP